MFSGTHSVRSGLIYVLINPKVILPALYGVSKQLPVGNLHYPKIPAVCSMGIESVVEGNKNKTSDVVHDAKCTACEMAVIWMANQIRRNQTEEQILSYVNEVN